MMANTKKSNSTTKDLQKVGEEIVKRGRGRPPGTGGNKRPDLSWNGNQNLQPGDNARYLRHAMASLNLPPIDIADDKQVEARINWFFNHCIEDDMKPTVSGLCNALGIDRQTFYNWGVGATRAETGNHLDLIKKARATMEELWEDYMLNGKVNPVTGIFLGKNHFGYQDKQEVVVTPNNPLGDADDTKALEDRYVDSVVVDIDDNSTKE